ncbi:MAG: Alpha/beta hydrolase family protein [Methanoregulaceae archaeon PtaB.Bin108]|nr:MAG: Alpha/beta hydrolase family protein [Methanoregulaceae archaeon PtaB.Bin108]
MKLAHLFPTFLLIALIITACCMGPSGTQSGTYSVNQEGILELDCPRCTVDETVLSVNENYTLKHVVFHSQEGDVFALAAIPPDPVAGFVLSPGAGVPKEGHQGRAGVFATQGYAYLVLDVRGNGGETGGYPMNLDLDFQKYLAEKWPQYYLSVCDVSSARIYLQGKSEIPVYATGESNGGRYAAIAAALDPGFAGYIGISTSGFSRAGDAYSGDTRKFLLSVDPVTPVEKMRGRSTWLFHAPGDPIIPYSAGQEFYAAFPLPKKFFAFNGTHGQNEETDSVILGECAQIYAPQR